MSPSYSSWSCTSAELHYASEGGAKVSTLFETGKFGIMFLPRNLTYTPHFTALLEHLYNESWNTLLWDDLEDYDFAYDVCELSEENDAYYYAYYNFIDVLQSAYHLNDPSSKLNEFAAEYWRQQRVAYVEDLLLGSTELRALFHPTEDYPTYDAMVSASINWAIDNHKDEHWSLERSAIEEMLYYKMINLVGVPAATLRPIYDKLMESVE